MTCVITIQKEHGGGFGVIDIYIFFPRFHRKLNTAGSFKCTESSNAFDLLVPVDNQLSRKSYGPYALKKKKKRTPGLWHEKDGTNTN